ncbi:hypothetical protein K504DRAFT_94069 [Pleomassaria siparia CBS 279.74]|uniref:Uncharacterized protein n=1 Tax=Pleomassaria siparia CBS 279.74 TaxID=1314801 RepID=A0A6G1JZK3_9PLEO|nr:hypothetical protein K504DRAFT_94069 [Pleomassaria siparia CBS 279.74]
MRMIGKAAIGKVEFRTLQTCLKKRRGPDYLSGLGHQTQPRLVRTYPCNLLTRVFPGRPRATIQLMSGTLDRATGLKRSHHGELPIIASQLTLCMNLIIGDSQPSESSEPSEPSAVGNLGRKGEQGEQGKKGHEARSEILPRNLLERENYGAVILYCV